ncbi:multidrug efflux SMR transporter subunit EbrB [Paenibacillus sp. JCM 10914]|uniref:DMT family transporter n=1 Tax=Paenibacillus sp. JCM 10914 TaxID=1236974 RepID=UPI0003CC67E9|nr:multidrug efflux SMR transporter [Paenibacillus sp. JCM 10914]GAE09743.1 multidrug resistance protein [Paenibacillus sp. JCM 10914]
MRSFIYLGLAIAFEAFGSTMLKISAGFTILWPSIGVAVGFLASFAFLSLSLKTIPLSTAYATWAGVGTALTALIGVVVFQESLGFLKAVALVLIIAGIVILNKAKGKAAAAVS